MMSAILNPGNNGTKPEFDESSDNDMKRTMNAHGLFSRNDIRYYDRFNRWGFIDPYERIAGRTREFVFFTKPDLHIFQNKAEGNLYDKLGVLPIFVDANTRYRDVLKELQYSVSNNPFSYLLYNKRKSNIDLPDIEADEEQTAANVYGTLLTYRKSSIKSGEAFDFSVEFEDGRYLDCYMYFKLYDEYLNRKYLCEVEPVNRRYTTDRINSEQTSAYVFITAEDGETLLYWAMLIGIYPKNVPRSTFSDLSEDGQIKFTVNFKSQFVDDMNPRILVDFNTLSKSMYSLNLGKVSKMKKYDGLIGGIDNTWAVIPYIYQKYDTLGKRNMYKLGWMG